MSLKRISFSIRKWRMLDGLSYFLNHFLQLIIIIIVRQFFHQFRLIVVGHAVTNTINSKGTQIADVHTINNSLGIHENEFGKLVFGECHWRSDSCRGQRYFNSLQIQSAELIKNTIVNLITSILCTRLFIPNGTTSVVGFYLDSDRLHHFAVQ